MTFEIEIVLEEQFHLRFNLHVSAGLQIFLPRHLLQLHHDDGGEQRGVDGGGAQLPPQDRGDPRDADVGPQCLSPVAPMDSSDGPTGKINIPIK